MDNLFDYIIILFFIVSAIASMFKSKKREEAKRAAQEKSGRPVSKPQRMEVRRPEYQSSKSEQVKNEKRQSFDPFEASAAYNPDRQEESASKNKSGYTFKELKSEVDKYFEEALLKSQLGVTEPPEPEPVLPPVVEHKSDAVPVPLIRKKSIVDVNRDRIVFKNRRAEDIRRQIMNKNDLKDLIVINEILNKPKALRK